MNIKMLSQITGLTVLLTDVFLVVPLLIALYDGQPRNIAAYAVTMVLMAVVGLALVLFSRGRQPQLLRAGGLCGHGHLVDRALAVRRAALLPQRGDPELRRRAV